MEEAIPEISYSAIVQAPVESVWTFVEDFRNWVTFLYGYQSHEIVNDRDSIWILKGEVGALTRTTKLRAHITEWNEPQIVTFTLEGLTEPISGSGSVEMRSYIPVEKDLLTRRSLVQRLSGWVGYIYRRLRGYLPGGKQLVLLAKATEGPAALVTVTLELNYLGPVAPMMNVLFAPLLKRVSEDLATKIIAEVEGRHVTLSGNPHL